MIQVLFGLIFAETTLILVFVFKTPLRKHVIMGLDLVKRGRGPTVVKTVATTLFLLMMATIYNVLAIHRRWIHDAAQVNPTDQLLLAKHLLEASLMGFSLFLALMVDRLHNYIYELRVRRKSMEAVKKQNRVFDDGKSPAPEEIKVLEDEMGKLRRKISKLEREVSEKSREVSKLERELQEKSKEVGSAGANAIALKKQSDGFHVEYDRLLEENQSLRKQLRSLDRKLSFSEGKKVM